MDMKHTAALTALLAAISWGASASAGGFLISKIGGDSAGPTSDSPSALFWNPAALGMIDGTELFIDNNLFIRSATFTRDTTGIVPEGQLFETAELLAVNTQPMLAIASPLGMRKFSFGLGLYAPFGASSTWDDPGGAQRFQSIFGGISSLYLTPAAVYSPSKTLHLGLSLSVVRTSLTSYRAFDFGPLVGDFTGSEVPAEQAGNEGRALLDFSGNAFSYAFGVVSELDHWTLGLSYTSEVSIHMEGSLKIFAPRNDFFQNLLGGDLDEPATLKTTWPRALRMGAAWHISPETTLSFSAEWVQWSLYDKVTIDVKNNNVAGLGNFDQEQITAYNNTLNIRLGARHRLDPKWLIFGGVGGENGAVPERHLDPSLFDTTKVGASLGFAYDMSEVITLSAGYNHLIYLPTIVSDTQVEPPPTGVHNQQVGIFNTNLTYRLD